MTASKKAFVILALLTASMIGMAQTRSAGGVVLDSLTQKPMEYIAVYFEGTASGCVTNYRGEFFLSDDSGAETLVVDAVGYGKRRIRLTQSRNQGLKILLQQEKLELKGALVKPKKERYRKKDNPAVELIRKVIENKDKNRIEEKQHYRCDLYEKLTLSLDDYHPDFEKKKKIGYLKQYIDTSEITGKPILTFSVRENLCDYYYRKSPKEHKTVRKASNHFGYDKEHDYNGGLSSTLEMIFTGVDIFDNEVKFIANRFVSPISSTIGTSYYKYYIMDTVKVNGVPCTDLAFVPFNSQSFGFTGRLYVTTDGKYSIKKVQLNFPSNSNVNWIDKLRIDLEFEQNKDGLWTLKREDAYVNLAVIEGTQGIFAHHTRLFRNHITDDRLLEGHKAYSIDGPVEIMPDHRDYNEEFWDEHRLEPLSGRESKVTAVTEDLRKKSPLTQWLRVADALISGYVATTDSNSTSKFDFGPLLSFVGYDYMEGVRLKIGGMTTANLSKRWFASGYVAYGFRDRKPKYNLKLTHSFNDRHYHPDERPVNNLSVSYTYDIFSPEVITDQHGLLTSLKTGTIKTLQYIRKANIKYEKQWLNSLKTSFWIECSRYTPATLAGDPGTLRYDLIGRDGTLTRIPFINTTEIGAQIRWAPGEKVFNAVSQSANIDKDTPIFLLTHYCGIRGFLGGQYDYNHTEFSVFNRFRLSVAGFLDAKVCAGIVWNKVPWPLLIMPAANQSFMYKRESFHMMNALEFVTDRYAQVNLTWHMKGLIFNRIPLIKKLKLRELLIFNGLYGGLSDKNNPALSAHSAGLFTLPQGTRSLGKIPYMEVGVGIENILQIFRVVYFYRLNYRHDGLSWLGKWGGIRFGLYADF